MTAPDNVLIRFSTRWPIQQIGPNEFQLEIPRGGQYAAISEAWAKEMGLSDGEYLKAEQAVLKSIAILD